MAIKKWDWINVANVHGVLYVVPIEKAMWSCVFGIFFLLTGAGVKAFLNRSKQTFVEPKWTQTRIILLKRQSFMNLPIHLRQKHGFWQRKVCRQIILPFNLKCTNRRKRQRITSKRQSAWATLFLRFRANHQNFGEKSRLSRLHCERPTEMLAPKKHFTLNCFSTSRMMYKIASWRCLIPTTAWTTVNLYFCWWKNSHKLPMCIW